MSSDEDDKKKPYVQFKICGNCKSKDKSKIDLKKCECDYYWGSGSYKEGQKVIWS